MTTKTMPTHASTAVVDIEPYRIAISPFMIEDLRERLGRARWPDEIEDSGWRYGTNRSYLRELCTHWGHGFDWKEEEERLNMLHHYCARIDGFGLHFIHEKGEGEKRIPLLLIHGWPDSFTRFLKLIPLLTSRNSQGFSFDVVIPSIPGFGFSAKPAKSGMGVTKVAELFAGLMRSLGYDNYFVHGGDWGSSIGEQLAIGFPKQVSGLHLTDVPYSHRFLAPEQMTEAEKKYFAQGQQWQMQEGAYALLQCTKPQTLAYAVNDSPTGLAAWIIEKFYAWTDHSGNLEDVYTRDELLVNLTIYWVTQTAGSSFRIYYEGMHNQQKQAKGRIDTPTAFCMAPRDMVNAPREFAERFFNVRQWTELPAGGHFLAMEKPGLLATDLFRFAELNEKNP